MSYKAVRGTFVANGSSAEAQIQQGGLIYIGSAGGEAFGGGTVTVQIKGIDGNYYASQDTSTASDVFAIEPPVPCSIRLTLTGATSPDIDYVIQTDSPVISE